MLFPEVRRKLQSIGLSSLPSQKEEREILFPFCRDQEIGASHKKNAWLIKSSLLGLKKDLRVFRVGMLPCPLKSNPFFDGRRSAPCDRIFAFIGPSSPLLVLVGRSSSKGSSYHELVQVKLFLLRDKVLVSSPAPDESSFYSVKY
ncbi:hypothetical protein V6N13_048467 [Hibiscus sabdariffa]